MAFSSFARFARAGAHRHQAAAAAAVLISGGSYHYNARCDAPPASLTPPVVVTDDPEKEKEEVFYHGMFPKRQLWQPTKEYPLWDANWDGRQPDKLEESTEQRRRQRHVRKEGITRHVILIRHGQYDEREKEDEKRVLTPLGREQADLTGRRLKEMMDGVVQQKEQNGTFKPKTPLTPVVINVMYVSDMTRAKETADIIGKHLHADVIRAPPDPLLNEGRPCHHIPAGSGKASANSIAKTDEGHERIEQAFRKYFHRADFVEDEKKEKEQVVDDNTTKTTDAGGHDKETMTTNKHVFEIYVCHANVIRYFTCRALQMPPEAWLRFCNLNCSLTYLTIRPTGTVSCRMFGDIGHIPYEKSTFSMHHGFNW